MTLDRPPKGWKRPSMPVRVISTHGRKERILAESIRDGVFEIDDLGRVWRLKARSGAGYRAVPRVRAEHDTGKYLAVRQCINGKRICCLAHRLVWHHMVGEIPEGFELNHINGDKCDNRTVNLEVVTRAENLRHAFATGLNTPRHGTLNGSCKYPDEVVRECFRLSNEGFLQNKISERLGVSKSHLSRIMQGKSRRAR